MSMTRERAAEWFETHMPTGRVKPVQKQAYLMAISALRPISRELVEQMKKEPFSGGYDEWWCLSYGCPECGYENAGKGNFCHNCGCPFTDEAVQMVMERLEALKGET